MKLHNEYINKLKCSECGDSFQTKFNLVKHCERKHDGRKPGEFVYIKVKNKSKYYFEMISIVCISIRISFAFLARPVYTNVSCHPPDFDTVIIPKIEKNENYGNELTSVDQDPLFIDHTLNVSISTYQNNVKSTKNFKTPMFL